MPQPLPAYITFNIAIRIMKKLKKKKKKKKKIIIIIIIPQSHIYQGNPTNPKSSMPVSNFLGILSRATKGKKQSPTERK